MKFKLNEDLFDDILVVPEVEAEVVVDPELSGPETPQAVGESSLILDAIANCTKNIDQYNVMKANITDAEMIPVIEDIVNTENITLGKLQSLLKKVSPNAENIMNGAVEAEQQLGESLKEEWSGVYSPTFLSKNLDIDREEAKKFSVYLWDNHADEGYKAMRDIADDYARLYDGKSALEYWYDEFKNLNESVEPADNEDDEDIVDTYSIQVVENVKNSIRNKEKLPYYLRVFGSQVNTYAKNEAEYLEMDTEFSESLKESLNIDTIKNNLAKNYNQDFIDKVINIIDHWDGSSKLDLAKDLTSLGMNYYDFKTLIFPSLDESVELAYETIDKKGNIKSNRKSFKDEKAMENFIDKVSEKDNFYRIVATSSDNLNESILDDAHEDANSICKFLDENKFYNYDLASYDTYPMDTRKVTIRVEGDWKHDHWRFKELVQEWADKNNRNIFKVDSEEVGESDSDYYTADYYIYITKDKESFDTLNSMRGLFSESIKKSNDTVVLVQNKDKNGKDHVVVCRDMETAKKLYPKRQKDLYYIMDYLEEDCDKYIKTESKLNEGDWEDPEWRKYYGVDDDSFYDPFELEDEEAVDDDFDESFISEKQLEKPINKKGSFTPLKVQLVQQPTIVSEEYGVVNSDINNDITNTNDALNMYEDIDLNMVDDEF